MKALSWQAQPTNRTCGQTCVAMLTARSVAQVCEEMGRWGRAGDSGIWLVLQAHGLEMDHAGAGRAPLSATPAILFLRHEDETRHWALWTGARVLDPGCGEFPTLLAAQERWAELGMTLVSQHAVTPRTGPVPEWLGERLALYRRNGETSPPEPGDIEHIAATALGDAELVRAMCSAVARYPESSAEVAVLNKEAHRRGRERVLAAITAVSDEREAARNQECRP
ncbi:hypothetical protein [Myxococcus sp. CA040A]|uniref:hypothetical protein n=1 Tax=Myxococcus sp. CA040A TaxID=2741738 RepID=UPI00157B3702|nr:hypothetical protein [Myxococcus sp. CA040A]NTX07015.1 hypothetical protein [Myxococcus sp. CA040A]